MRTMTQAHGPDAHGTLLLLLAMPCLPRREAGLELPREWAQRAWGGLASVHTLEGRHARIGLDHLAFADLRSATALAVGSMATIAVMPIPFRNLLPAVALVATTRPAADGLDLEQRMDPGLGFGLNGTER